MSLTNAAVRVVVPTTIPVSGWRSSEHSLQADASRSLPEAEDGGSPRGDSGALPDVALLDYACGTRRRGGNARKVRDGLPTRVLLSLLSQTAARLYAPQGWSRGHREGRSP